MGSQSLKALQKYLGQFCAVSLVQITISFSMWFLLRRKKPEEMEHDLMDVENLENFLQPIIQNILRLQEVGVDFNEEHFDVQLLRVVFDAPARSLVKCTIAHNNCSSLR